MDARNPLRTLSSTVDADVLAVLGRTHAPLTGAKIARLAERSYAQTRHVLRRLVDEGLVASERHGNAYSYTLNRAHVLATVVERALGSVDRVEHALRDAAGQWAQPAEAVALFGSFVRGQAGPQSDVDVLLVRPDPVPADDPAWTSQRYEFSRLVEDLTGNRSQIVELSVAELHAAALAGQSLVVSLRRDAMTLVGDLAPHLAAESDEQGS